LSPPTTFGLETGYGWLGDLSPFQHKNRLYRGPDLGWRFHSARL